MDGTDITVQSTTQKPMDIRQRIRVACEELIASGKPVTRRQIALIVGCDPRTVSTHKDVWKPYVEEISAPNQPASHFRKMFQERLMHIEESSSRMSLEKLHGVYDCLNWFDTVVKSPADKELLERVRASLLSKLEVGK